MNMIFWVVQTWCQVLQKTIKFLPAHFFMPWLNFSTAHQFLINFLLFMNFKSNRSKTAYKIKTMSNSLMSELKSLKIISEFYTCEKKKQNKKSLWIFLRSFRFAIFINFAIQSKIWSYFATTLNIFLTWPLTSILVTK